MSAAAMPREADPPWMRFASAASAAAHATGDAAFPRALFDWVNAAVRIDSCAVFEFDARGRPRHVFTYGRLGEDVGAALARDYTQRFARSDPGARRLDSDAGRVVAFDELTNYPRAYRDHFFVRHALIDKAALIQTVARRRLYCNFYRMTDTGPFSAEDWRALKLVLPIAGAVIAQHVLAGATRLVCTQGGPYSIPAFDVLAPRERAVCERILAGRAAKDIARDLGVAESTIITHRRRAYAKLGVASGHELFKLALEGAVDLGG